MDTAETTHTERTTPSLEAACVRRRELLEAVHELERAVAAPTPGREHAWRARVGEVLVHLRSGFDDHISTTEGENGLFDEIVLRTPRLIHFVDRLRVEHRQIRARIEEIIEHLARAGEAAASPEAIRRVILLLLLQITRHRQRGADVIWEAYWVDIGGLD